MEYEALKLENQLCFPLYAAARDVVKKYTPHLEALGLTYTQYITMMVLWEHRSVTAKELGARLFLDSGTLTPLLKKLEGLGYLRRARNEQDERSLLVQVTDEGLALRERAKDIPAKVGQCLPLPPQEAAELYRILYTLLGAAK